MTGKGQPADDWLDQVLENLYYSGMESDSIEVVGGGNNKDHAITKAKQALTAWADTRAREAVEQYERKHNKVVTYKPEFEPDEFQGDTELRTPEQEGTAS